MPNNIIMADAKTSAVKEIFTVEQAISNTQEFNSQFLPSTPSGVYVCYVDTHSDSYVINHGIMALRNNVPDTGTKGRAYGLRAFFRFSNTGGSISSTTNVGANYDFICPVGTTITRFFFSIKSA